MASIWSELKRRNVIKVGAAYAIVAWLLMQIADVMLPALGAPQWTISFITVLLLIGFPITLIIAWAFDVTPQGIKSASGASVADVPTRATVLRFGYVSQALILIAVGFLVVDQYVLGPRAKTVVPEEPGSIAPTASSSSPLVRRYNINLGPTVPLGTGGGVLDAEIALSQDGKRLAYAIQPRDGDAPRIYLRELDQTSSQPLPGTGAGRRPFFSPGGEWIGYVSLSSRALMRTSVRGGAPEPIAENATIGGGAFWNADDTIFLTSNDSGRRRLHRVPVSGGVFEPLDIDSSEQVVNQGWPHVLPGGEAMLFTAGSTEAMSEGDVSLLLMETGEIRSLIHNAYNARYAPSGHIVFMRSAALWAVPFDLDRFEKSGPEALVVPGVETASGSGTAIYAFSNDGLLVYLPGADTQVGAWSASLVWVDRQGNEEPVDLPPQAYSRLRLSPDGRRLAVTIDDGGNKDIWIYNLELQTSTRLTFNPAAEEGPVWTPDGKHLIYSSTRGGSGLFLKPADGTGQEVRLTTSVFRQYPESIVNSSDGILLVYREDDGSQASDLHLLTLDDEPTSRPLLQTRFDEDYAAISPNGRWFAYEGMETGQSEILVRPFPNATEGAVWQVSRNGGAEPYWGPDGRELFYVRGKEIMVAAVETDLPAFTAENPEPLFEGNYVFEISEPNYNISSDGKRLLMMKLRTEPDAAGSPEQTTLVAVENWFEELKRLAPPSP